MKMCRLRHAAIAVVLAAGGLAAPALADPAEGVDLIINGDEQLTTVAETPDYLEGALPKIYSGWLFRDEATRAMEMDDFDNPAMVFVDQGLDTWNTPDGSEGKSCADCHGGIEKMAGIRASMPKMNKAGDDLWSMENFINDCRVNRMGAEAWGWNDDNMKNVTAAISVQSRGMPVAVDISGPAHDWWEKGKEIYYTRYGQLEFSCANCHETNFGHYIRADHLSQGQINGFPTYRLKDAGLVSIQGRFKGCVRDNRAETFKEGSPEFRALELYVASRGQGLSVEGVAVRP